MSFYDGTPSLHCLDPFHHDDLRCHTVSATRRSNRPGELYIFVKVQNVSRLAGDVGPLLLFFLTYCGKRKLAVIARQFVGALATE